MDTCTILVASLAFIVVTDLVLLLNAPTIVKRRIRDPLASEGESSLHDRQTTIVRLALGVAIAATIGIFLFVLSQNGCLA